MRLLTLLPAFILLDIATLLPLPGAPPGAVPWIRHVIDDASRGADGARLADVNGDGLLDIATGWEQGGVVRIAFHPGKERVKERWTTVDVARVGDVEDAVLVDLDGDGALDMLSSCEGKVGTLFVSWSPKDKTLLTDPRAWRTESIPSSVKAMLWMYALPMQIDGRHGPDFFAGGKGPNSQIGWYEAPENPRDLTSWRWHPLRPAGWTMSLIPSDMDGDGDSDLVFTDRKMERSGAFWLENPGPGPAQAQPWKEHPIGGVGREVMFLHLADLDGDSLEDVLIASKPAEVLYMRRKDRSGTQWEEHIIPFPTQSGTAKAVSVGDIDLDGRLDLVISCERAKPPLKGLSWLSREGASWDKWQSHDISGPDGVKHDLVPLVDLDGDGDLDVITTEEITRLGVIWYENPTR